jgi:IclR family acetate operon transcriptional repressor
MATESNGEWRKTTTTSLQVIDSIGELNGGSLSEIAERMEISTSTLYTHLKTLEYNEYIKKENGKYRLGFKLFHLGEKARYRDNRYSIAKEEASELAATINEEVNFVVEEHGRVIVLFGERRGQLGEEFQTGKRLYMHNTASGKVILAAFSKERVVKILDKWGMSKETDETIVEREELQKELQQVYEQGYAVNNQEGIEGLQAVAVPVMNTDGSVFGALDVSGPSYRFPAVEELVEKLQSSANDLEERIGNRVNKSE